MLKVAKISVTIFDNTVNLSGECKFGKKIISARNMNQFPYAYLNHSSIKTLL